MAGFTERGRLVLVLAGGIYLVAWAFGSRSLYPAAIGLALAAIGARLWVAIIRQPVSLKRTIGTKEPLEGDDVTVGTGAAIIQGVTVGAGTVIGAGAVVTRDLPAGVVAVGCPARAVRDR